MTTALLLFVMMALLALGVSFLLRAKRSGRLALWQLVLLSFVLAFFLVFLVWLAFMVLVVGPHMRAM